jgi:ketosteroid isomerase-like protein
MSQENVEVARAAFDAFNRDDLGGVLSFLAEDCEWRPPAYAVDGVAYLGHADYAAWFEGLKETWSSLDATATFSSAGDRHVIAEVRAAFIGRASATPVDVRYWIVYSLNQGKVTRMEAFRSQADALEAVGLRE